jgi:16S rRNA (adenine1518-N6/adenine1519-N6)-dimethyltransferase
MIQHEVAQRILAQPGTKEYGVLTLGVQVRAKATRCFSVPPGAFRPPPKVKSAVIRITPRETPLLSGQELEHFMAVVRAAFGARRKTLKKALGRLNLPTEQILEALATADIDPQIRGERLDLDTFTRLTRALFPQQSD